VLLLPLPVVRLKGPLHAWPPRTPGPKKLGPRGGAPPPRSWAGRRTWTKECTPAPLPPGNLAPCDNRPYRAAPAPLVALSTAR
jgi:hypothetical protein